MTKITQPHPIRSIGRIIFSIAVYVMGVYFPIALSAFFTIVTKKLNGFSNPNSFSIVSPICLKRIKTGFRTKFSSAFILIRFAFKCNQTEFTFDSRPIAKSFAFTSIPMCFPSIFNRICFRVSSIVTQFATVFVPFSQGWVETVSVPAKLTGAFNFIHRRMLTEKGII